MNTPTETVLKVQPWSVVQEDILKLLRTPAFLDTNMTITHSPQLLQSMPAGSEIRSLCHFSAKTGDVITAASKNRQLYVWTLNKSNKALHSMDPHQKLKAVGEIAKMIYIPGTRTFIGYCTDKTLRVFMDPVTGCEDIAYLVINQPITSLVYNKDTHSVLAGGKGYLESFGIEGTEFRTTLQKGQKIKTSITKDETVVDMKMDTRHKQVMVVTDKGIHVVKYATGEHTHILVNRHTGSLTCCCVYHEGEFLVTGSSEGDLKIWNSVVYTQVHEFPGHIKKVTAIACLPKDPVLFSASEDGTLYVWRMDTFQKFMKLNIRDPICSMKLFKDGTLMAQTPNDIFTYSLKQFYTTYATANANIVKLVRLRSLCHTANRVLVSTEDGRIQLYNPPSGTLVAAMLPLPKTQIVEEIAYSGSDGKMYTVLRSGEVLVLNTNRNPFRPVELLQPPQPEFKVTCVALMAVSFGSPVGQIEQTLIFMGTVGGTVCVMESHSILMETPQIAHKGGVLCLHASCDSDRAKTSLKLASRYLVSAGMDNMVKLWALEFEPGMGGWTLSLQLIQDIDCMGSPSHVAMFENIICVAFGEYGLVKMFRLAGLTKAEHSSKLQGLYVLLTHVSSFDHTDTITALDMCPLLNLFITCACDGFVKVWDTDNRLVREMSFGQAVNSVCFLNSRGDVLIGFQNRVLMVPVTKYLPQYYLEKLSSMIFRDDITESPIEINAKRRKLWFDPKTVPKYSTDLVARMTQKVKMKAAMVDDDGDSMTLERMRSDLSTDSGIGSVSVADSRPSLTRENTSLSLHDALQRDNSSEDLSGDNNSRAGGAGGARSRSRKGSRLGRKRPSEFGGAPDMRKVSVADVLEEEDEEEDDAPTSKDLRLAREDSLLYFRKPSIWLHGKELTPSTIRDLQMAAQMTRDAELMLPEYLQRSTQEVIPITPEPKKGPEYTVEQLKTLTPWERFLLTKKPIIAPDGYIPNSVVRAQIGFIPPPSPSPEWRLKPVPQVDPKHMPEGWKPKREWSRSNMETLLTEDMDIDNIMDMKRESTLQSVKVQQSIKEASLYIGTTMCLLPNGTEPEAVPNFIWRSDVDDVADLSPLARPRSEDLTPAKESAVVTPVSVKATPDQESSFTKAEKVKPRALKKVDIDLSSGLTLGSGAAMPRGPALVGKMPSPLEPEGTKMFRLSQTKSDLTLDPPQEDAEQNISEETGSNTSPAPTEQSGATVTSSQGRRGSKSKAKKGGSDVKAKMRAEDRIKKAVPKRQPIAAPVKKISKEDELTLLQKIVKEEWFPEKVPPLLDMVNDELTKLLNSTDSKIFTAVCDYLVQIFQQLSIAAKFLNRASAYLSKQLPSPSGIIRKKAVWTMKQLGLSPKKEALSSLIPGLLEAREESREDMLTALTDVLGASSDGLTSLMSSLGINKTIGSKEDQTAAIKMISEKLQEEMARGKSGDGQDSVKKRMEMWVSSLTLPQDVNILRSGGTNSRPLESTLGSRGHTGLEAESSFMSDGSGKPSRGSTRGRGRSRRKSKSRRKAKGGKGSKSGGRDGEKDDIISVDMSVQTDPRDSEGEGKEDGGGEGGEEDDGRSRRRRGRWRRGGMSEFRNAGEFTDEEDEDGYYGEDDDGDDDDGDDNKQDKVKITVDEDGLEGNFTRLEFDLTPSMFRSETGGSEWSDEVPNLINNAAPGRPKGASVHKFYERRDQAQTVVGNDGSRLLPGGQSFLKMPRIAEPHPRDPNDPNYDPDSDLQSESNETTHSGKDMKDTISVVDSGIGKDIYSEASSHIYGGSDSLYDQGRPRLSPIKSTSNLQKTVEKKKEPEWKDFFSADRVLEKRKAADFVEKEVAEDTTPRISVLPPIMYFDPGHPTFPGEAGLRLLHSIRLADRERTADNVGHLVEALPGRLTISTQHQPSGDTTYGVLQMHWTTNVPALPPDSSALTDRPYDRRHGMPPPDHHHHHHHREALTERPEHAQDRVPTLPRLQRRETTGIVHKSCPNVSLAKEKTLPVLPSREKTDFQWSKPMAPPPKRPSLMGSQQIRVPHCPNYKWAAKKMNNYISSDKNLHLPKMEERSQTMVTSSLQEDVMSIISHSSLGLMANVDLDKLFKTMKLPSSY